MRVMDSTTPTALKTQHDSHGPWSLIFVSHGQPNRFRQSRDALVPAPGALTIGVLTGTTGIFTGLIVDSTADASGLNGSLGSLAIGALMVIGCSSVGRFFS
jgi:hypothetical protein